MSRPRVGPAVHTRLTEELLAAVDAAAEAEGVSRPEIMRRLLAEALEARAKGARRKRT